MIIVYHGTVVRHRGSAEGLASIRIGGGGGGGCFDR